MNKSVAVDFYKWRHHYHFHDTSTRLCLQIRVLIEINCDKSPFCDKLFLPWSLIFIGQRTSEPVKIEGLWMSLLDVS